MPQAKPAGLDEAMRPFKALQHAWDMSTNHVNITPQNPLGGIADSSLLRNAMPLPNSPTVGDVRTLIRVMESFYGEFPL